MIDSVAEFLDKLSSTDVRKALVLFFHHHQFAMDTANNLAKWVKGPSEEVARELEALVGTKVLERMGNGYSAIYFYTQDLEIIETVDKFLRHLAERGTRP